MKIFKIYMKNYLGGFVLNIYKTWLFLDEGKIYHLCFGKILTSCQNKEIYTSNIG